MTGLLVTGHGVQKLFGWFGGKGFTSTIEVMEKISARPDTLWTGLNALAKFAGVLGLAAGLFTPIASAGLVGSMVVGIAKVHWPKGLWNTKDGIEFPLLMGAVVLVIGLIGPGAFSFDSALGLNLPEPQVDLVLLGITLVVTFGLLLFIVKPKAGLNSKSSIKPS